MRREAYDTWAASEEGSAPRLVCKFGEEYKTLSNAVTVALKALDERAAAPPTPSKKPRRRLTLPRRPNRRLRTTRTNQETKLEQRRHDTKKDRLDAANGLLKQVEGIDYSEQEAKVREALEKTDEEAKAVSTSLSEEDAFNLVADVAALFERRTSVNMAGFHRRPRRQERLGVQHR